MALPQTIKAEAIKRLRAPKGYRLQHYDHEYFVLTDSGDAVGYYTTVARGLYKLYLLED